MHKLSTIGAFFNAFGYALAVLNLAVAAIWGTRRVGSNPYNALGLEWVAPSPPPHDNFPTVPVVTGSPYDYGVPVEEIVKGVKL